MEEVSARYASAGVPHDVLCRRGEHDQFTSGVFADIRHDRWWTTTTTLGYFVFVSAFEDFRMGYASAVGVVLFVIVMFFTLIQFRLRKSWVHY